MTTPFLTGFAQALVRSLLEEGLLEIQPGSEARVAAHVAGHLATVREGGSLISEVDRALIGCDEVDELFADAEQLKDLVQHLRP